MDTRRQLLPSQCSLKSDPAPPLQHPLLSPTGHTSVLDALLTAFSTALGPGLGVAATVQAGRSSICQGLPCADAIEHHRPGSRGGDGSRSVAP